MQNLHGCPLSARVKGESDCVNNISKHSKDYIVVHLQHIQTHEHTHICVRVHTPASETGLNTYHAQLNKVSSKHMLAEHLLS